MWKGEVVTSKERILAAWNGDKADHVPMTTWSFGVTPPKDLRWELNGEDQKHWYTLRLEHIHTLPQPWTLEDDFNRVLAWQKLGVDDLLDISVPWSTDPEVTLKDSVSPSGEMDSRYPVLVREYQTPSGSIRHAIRQTDEDHGEGWVTQPDHVPLFDDFNIPRAVEHAVSNPSHVAAIKHLYMPPDESAREWFCERAKKVKAFADKQGVPVQAWAAFGMDGVVWLTGTEGAILLSMDDPEAFGELLDTVNEVDQARAELAASTPGVDMIVIRGWYSSTDFWSPTLFDKFVFPGIKRLAEIAHKHGKKFGCVITTGVEMIGKRMADAGVDVLYFLDPVQDGLSVETAKQVLSDRITLVGGTNSISLQSGDSQRIQDEVKRALDVLGPTNRFILHPVDSLFPDTPWEGVETMIEAWEKYR